MFFKAMHMYYSHLKNERRDKIHDGKSIQITSAMVSHYMNIHGLSGKSTAVVNTKECFVRHRCNLAKESGLECACMNNADFPVPVSGDSGCL